MNIFSQLTFVAFVIYLYLGSYALKLDSKSGLNRVFSLLCSSLGIWAFAYSFVYAAPDKEVLWFWFRISALGWCTFGGISLHFLLVLTGKETVLKKRWIFPALYFPGLLFVYRAWTGIITARDFIQTPLGWVEVGASDSIWLWLHTLNFSSCVIIGVFLTWRWGSRSKIGLEKKQARVIVSTIALSLILGTLINIILPALKIQVLPGIAPIITLIWAFGIWQAITKYRLMVLTPRIAAGEITSRMRDLLIMANPQGLIVGVNPETGRLLGYHERDLLGKPVTLIIPEESAWNEIIAMMRETSLSMSDRVTDCRTRNGENVPVHASCSSVKDRAGDVVGAIIVGHDLRPIRRLEEEIAVRRQAEEALLKAHEHLEMLVQERTAELARTNEALQGEIAERSLSEEALRESERRYRTLFETSQESIFVMRGEVIVDCNPAAERIFKSPRENIIGSTPFRFSPEFQPDGRRSVEKGTDVVRQAIREGPQRFEWEHQDLDGVRFYMEVSLSHFHTGGQSYLFVLQHDISDRKRAEEALRALSLKDDLTGLYNRRGFSALAEQELKIANRMKKGMFLLFADLDHLKKINDTFGHQEGDLALIEVANILRENFRKSDVVARLGGDEFAVLGIETGEGKIQRLNKELNQAIRDLNATGKHPYPVSLSTGVVSFDAEHPVSMDQLLAEADRLMYGQKRQRTDS